MDPWDVIVVGAGVTGMTLARLLHDDGARVLLVDKSHRPGGRLASRNIGGMLLDSGPQQMWCESGEVHELLSRWVGVTWSGSPEMGGTKVAPFPTILRDVAQSWSEGLRIQRSHVTHLVHGAPGEVGIVRHGFGDTIWARHVVLTAPVPQAQSIIAYSDFVLDYSLDDVAYRRRQVLLATVEGEGIAPDSSWSTDIIESVRLRPHPEGLLGIEVCAREAWSEATWDDDSSISQGRLLLELGLLLGHARVIDTEVVRWRYSVTENPFPGPYWRHPDVESVWMAGDGFGEPQDFRHSIERATLSALAVYRGIR